MAKKVPLKQEGMANTLLDGLSHIPADELEQIFKIFANQMSYVNNQPHVIYSYQRPDYAKSAQPIAKYLLPIEQMGWDYYPAETYIEDLLSVPAIQLAKDLENLMMNGLADYQQLGKEDEPIKETKFIAALLLLKEIHATQSLDIVLELLRQDITFFENYFDNSGCDVFPVVLYHLGSDQLPKLLDFIKEPGLCSFGKAYTFTAVANIAGTTPERRQEVIAWISEVLNFYYENKDNETVFDGIIIDSFAYDITNIHGEEVLLPLEKLYATNQVVTLIAPDIKDIRYSISRTPTQVLDDWPICQMMERLEIMSPIPFDEDDDDFSFDDFLSERVPIDLSTSQCFTLRISLQHIEPEIWRLVEVPSMLMLDQLHEVIQTVMGWEDRHLHQFSKGKKYYIPEEQLEDQTSFGTSECYDYTDFAIEELLLRKKSKICYEYDFGDGWKHDITLEARRPYKTNEQPRIALLDGANACPPEDCGGYPGYMTLKEAMKNKRTKAYKEYAEWLGYSFDPQAFGNETEEINEMLEGIL